MLWQRRGYLTILIPLGCLILCFQIAHVIHHYGWFSSHHDVLVIAWLYAMSVSGGLLRLISFIERKREIERIEMIRAGGLATWDRYQKSSFLGLSLDKWALIYPFVGGIVVIV